MYFKDAQFVFSRVQHHIHKRTKTGYQPLSTCPKKGAKKPKCGFPKTKQITPRLLVICCGIVLLELDIDFVGPLSAAR